MHIFGLGEQHGFCCALGPCPQERIVVVGKQSADTERAIGVARAIGIPVVRLASREPVTLKKIGAARILGSDI